MDSAIYFLMQTRLYYQWM